MRTKDEIKQEALSNIKSAGGNYAHGAAILEVLLDIRDLLSTPSQQVEKKYGARRIKQEGAS